MPQVARAKVYLMIAQVNMPGPPEETHWVADIRVAALLFYSSSYMDCDTGVAKLFHEYFGDDIDVPRSNEVLVQSMTMLEIVRFAELGQQPHHDSATWRNMKESFRCFIQVQARHITDTLHNEGKSRWNLTVNWSK